jgi:hypothetical protein
MSSKAKKKSVRPIVPKTDVRLLGTWKSDAKRTFQEWTWRKTLPPEKKKRIKSLFGKLEVTYNRTKVISKLRHRNWTSSRSYTVLGVDETSVAIITFGELEVKKRKKDNPYGLELLKNLYSKPQIQQIYFDQKHYWISIGNGKNREFFRKIRNRK